MFTLWFNFILMIIYNNEFDTNKNKIKLKPRIKLYHNTYSRF